MKVSRFPRAPPRRPLRSPSARCSRRPRPRSPRNPAGKPGSGSFAATLYGWVPTIDQKVNFPGDPGSSDIHVSKSDVLDHLKMTFQGSLDAHNGRWGMFTDILYMDLGGVQVQRRAISRSATSSFRPAPRRT